MKQIKVTVKTPNNQAKKCVQSLKRMIIGYKNEKNIIKQKVTTHKEFYYIIKITKTQDYKYYNTQTTISEQMIKNFYKQLYKVIRWTNRSIRLANKFGKKGIKGIEWTKKRMNKILTNKIPDKESREKLRKQIEENIQETNHNKEILQEIIIDDQKEMDELLKGEIITLNFHSVI